jgi:hypothetical protein
MLSDATKIAILKSAPKLSHIELIELVAEECRLAPRAWIGLTEEEKQDLYDRWVRTGDGWGLFYLFIEAKLQEKNT